MYCDWPVLGRCCFCVPLRKGVLVLGYFSILYNAFLIGLHSYTIHHEIQADIAAFGRLYTIPAELCIALCCAEIIFDAILVYGAHMKLPRFIQWYYYFALSTVVAMLLLQIIDLCRYENNDFGMIMESLTLSFAGLCMQVYLITLVRSLLRKMVISENHGFENQLQQITTGEIRIDTNGIYNNTTAPADV